MLITFGLLLLFFTSLWLENKLSNELKTIDGLQFEALNVDWNCKNISLENIVYQSKLNSSTLSCKELYITEIGRWQLLWHKQFSIGDFTIKNVNLTLLDSIQQSKEKNTKTSNLPDIYIQNFHFENINLDFKKEKTFNLHLENNYGQISELSYSPQEYFPLKFKHVTLKNKGGYLENSKGHYRTVWKNIHIDDAKRKWSISNLDVLPLHTKEGWNTYFEYKKSRLQLKTSKIYIFGSSTGTFLQKDLFYADSIIVEKPELDVFVDNSIPPCPDCYKPLLHEQLSQLKPHVIVPELKVRNSTILIEVLNENNQDSGTLRLDKTYASIYDIDNKATQKEHFISADIQTQFMQASQLDVSFVFFLDAPSYPYQFKGSMKNLNLNNINSFLAPSKNSRFKSGHLQYMAFNGSGNNNSSTGEITLDYKNLEIELLKKTAESEKVFYLKSSIKLVLKIQICQVQIITPKEKCIIHE